MRKVVISLLLVSSLLACNVSAQIEPPTQVNTSTATITPKPSLTPTPTIVSGYPIISVPIQAIQVMDDDGGRLTPITAEEVTAWVSKTNEIYAWSGIQFTFSGQDLVTLRSTLLNNMAGDQDEKWLEEIAYGDQVAAQYPGKLVLFFRWGPGNQPTGGAFSSSQYNFVAMSIFGTSVCGYQNIGMLAHEIGHYLSLSHTFPQVYQNEAEAETALENNGNDPATFDADGFSDTLPDPFIAMEKYQCPPLEGVTLNGIYFPLPRDNIMSYYEVRTGLSEMQIEQARWALSTRMAHDMAWPNNAAAPDPVEAQDMSLVFYSDCFTGYQDMSPWGTWQWYNGDQLFVSSAEDCIVTLGLQVKTAGKYRLDLYLTSAPDFGIIQAFLDGNPIGEPINLYTPLVMPTGAIPVGTFDLTQEIHLLKFKVVGTNEKSNNYSFGLDGFSLVPQP